MKNQHESFLKAEEIEKNESTPLFENSCSNNKKFLIE